MGTGDGLVVEQVKNPVRLDCICTVVYRSGVLRRVKGGIEEGCVNGARSKEFRASTGRRGVEPCPGLAPNV